MVTADGASAEQDWFTRLGQDLLSNTLICSVDSVTRVLTTWGGMPSADGARGTEEKHSCQL